MPSDQPSAWAVETATKLTPVQCGFKGGSDLGWHGTRDAIARALDAAEQRGFDRAVNETAIASIHKAVAAERGVVVKAAHDCAVPLRGLSQVADGAVALQADGGAKALDIFAGFIERGKHREENERG